MFNQVYPRLITTARHDNLSPYSPRGHGCARYVHRGLKTGKDRGALNPHPASKHWCPLRRRPLSESPQLLLLQQRFRLKKNTFWTRSTTCCDPARTKSWKNSQPTPQVLTLPRSRSRLTSSAFPLKAFHLTADSTISAPSKFRRSLFVSAPLPGASPPCDESRCKHLLPRSFIISSLVSPTLALRKDTFTELLRHAPPRKHLSSSSYSSGTISAMKAVLQRVAGMT